MIKLKNVSKTYVSRSGHEVRALKGVSFELDNTGMVFVLGKSGSGKSTLLNILGGLDAASDGDVIVDGTSMRNFSQADYDGYRNGYVGFIFQEYNLLDDFDVKENIALALQLEHGTDIDGKVADALRQVELPEQYTTHRVSELSGGEKQRVAIARCLIKNSKMILADEPTGNLDSATGTSIWDLLKKLSRTQLVVVVSHDRESAEKYADRIIEIADGEVRTDSNSATAVVASDNQSFVAVHKRLPFKTRLRMAWNTMKLRKGKTIGVILLAILGIFSILITQMCLCYSPEKTLAKYIKENDVQYFSVGQGEIDKNNKLFNTYQIWKNSSKQYVYDNSNCIVNGIVQSKQEVLDFGLTFVGEALELDNESFYVTSDYLADCYEQGFGRVEVNGEFVEIVKEFHPVDFLIGKRVDLRMLEGVLAGVINTESLNCEGVLRDFFYNPYFKSSYLGTNDNTFNLNDTEVILNYGDNAYKEKFTFANRATRFLSESVVTADGIKQTNEIELKDNEIVLSYYLYSKLFDANSKGYYISEDLTELRNTPREIGQSFSLSISHPDESDLLLDCGRVRLAGVVFSDKLIEEQDKYIIAVDEQLARTIDLELTPHDILIQTSSVRNLGRFVTTLRNRYLGYVQRAGFTTDINDNKADLSVCVYEFEQIMQLVSWIFIALGILLTVILILLVINLISLSIAARKKEVGILSALGTSNRDITSIFILETMIIAAITFVIVLALVIAFVPLINHLFSQANQLMYTLPFMRVDLLTIAILALSSFGLLLLAALIPLRRIVGMKPIDAIRNN